MRGGDGVHLSRGHQLTEPTVAQTARRFFNGFGYFAGCWVSSRLGGDIHAILVKRQAERRGKFTRECQIRIGFLAPQAVVQVGGVQD